MRDPGIDRTGLGNLGYRDADLPYVDFPKVPDAVPGTSAYFFNVRDLESVIGAIPKDASETVFSDGTVHFSCAGFVNDTDLSWYNPAKPWARFDDMDLFVRQLHRAAKNLPIESIGVEAWNIVTKLLNPFSTFNWAATRQVWNDAGKRAGTPATPFEAYVQYFDDRGSSYRPDPTYMLGCHGGDEFVDGGTPANCGPFHSDGQPRHSREERPTVPGQGSTTGEDVVFGLLSLGTQVIGNGTGGLVSGGASSMQQQHAQVAAKVKSGQQRWSALFSDPIYLTDYLWQVMEPPASGKTTYYSVIAPYNGVASLVPPQADLESVRRVIDPDSGAWVYTRARFFHPSFWADIWGSDEVAPPSWPIKRRIEAMARVYRALDLLASIMFPYAQWKDSTVREYRTPDGTYSYTYQGIPIIGSVFPPPNGALPIPGISGRVFESTSTEMKIEAGTKVSTALAQAIGIGIGSTTPQNPPASAGKLTGSTVGIRKLYI